jgi:SNF2 family DNA or RNA helicase
MNLLMSQSIKLSRQHKTLGVPFGPAIEHLFPDAPRIEFKGVPHVILPHQPTETYLLRKLGYDIPAPILSHYDWCGGSPFDVQKKTCALLTMNERAYCLNSMGTGKTKAALWAWDFLNKQGLAKKLLVVAPLSTLSFTWAKEVHETVPHRTVRVLHGSRQKRLSLLEDDVDIFIINHDGVSVIMEALISDGRIDTLVLDELAVYRNGGTARTKGAKKLSAKMRWAWGMTGAPQPNSPTDVWAQAAIITPARVPKYFSRFREDIMVKAPYSPWKWLPKHDAVERAFDVLQPSVRFTLDDVIELPEIIYRTIDVPMSPQQHKAYQDMVAHCLAAIGNEKITAANAGVLMGKLQQISLGWAYNEGQTVSLDNSERMDALLDIIDAAEQKLLVFAPFRNAIAGISARLKKDKITHEVVTGATTNTERSEIFHRFQNQSEIKVLVAHPQCLAHGITLTAADTIVWFAPVTSLETYDQANARIRRVGQKHKQLILHLQASPVEKRIYKMLQNKQNAQAKLLELFEEASRDP